MLIKNDVIESDNKWENLAEIYFVDKLHGNTFPLTYRIVDKHQRKYNEILQKQIAQTIIITILLRWKSRAANM